MALIQDHETPQAESVLWIAAHAVMFVRYKAGPQTEFPVRERVYLIEGSNPQVALDVATRLAQQEEGDANGTFAWKGRPADWVFAGVRKLIAFSYPDSESGPMTGGQITYSEMVVDSLDDVRRLANGDAVDVKSYD